MANNAIGGKEAHERWGRGTGPSMVKDLHWDDLDIYQIAAQSLDLARKKLKNVDSSERRPEEFEQAYAHIRQLAYRGTQDFIETTLHSDLAVNGRRHDATRAPAALNLDAGETQYVDTGADEVRVPGSKAGTFADLIKEDWQSCVAPDSLYAWDSPAAYTAALYGEIARITSAQEKLLGRRSDIAATLISRRSIDHEDHELDRVIRILNSSRGNTGLRVDAPLASRYFPWNLPFLEPFETIKAALRCQGTTFGDLLFDVREAFQLHGNSMQKQQSDDLWIAYLGIAKEERAILTGPPWAEAFDPTDYFGHLVSTTSSASTPPDSSSRPYTLDLDALCDVLQFDEQDKSKFLDAVRLTGNASSACAYFTDNQATFHDHGQGVSCGYMFLDRLHRFVRLYRWLKLDLGELVALLNILAADTPAGRASPFTQEQMLNIGLFCMLRSRYQFRVKDFRAVVHRPPADRDGEIVNIEQLSLKDRTWLQTEYSVSGADLDVAFRLVTKHGIKLTAAEFTYTVARLKLLARIAQVPLNELEYVLASLEAFAETPRGDSVKKANPKSSTTSHSADSVKINKNLLCGQSSTATDSRNFLFNFCVLSEWRIKNKIKAVKLNDVVVLNKNLIAKNISLDFMKAIVALTQDNTSGSDSLSCLARVMSSDYQISLDSARDSLKQLNVPVMATLAKHANEVLSTPGPFSDPNLPEADAKFSTAVAQDSNLIGTKSKYIFALLIQDAFIASCMSIASADLRCIAAQAADCGFSLPGAIQPQFSKSDAAAECIMLDDGRLNFNALGTISMLKTVMEIYGLSRDDFDGIKKTIKENCEIIRKFSIFKDWAEGLQRNPEGRSIGISDLQWAYCYARLQKLSQQYGLPIDLLMSIVAGSPEYRQPAMEEIKDKVYQVFVGAS